MAVDAFIWFENPGVSSAPEGETQDSVYKAKKAFEIKDFTFGVENPTTIGSATGGAGAGKVKFAEFQIKKITDLASPLFFKNCCVGAHYDTVTIEMRKSGGDAMTTGKPFMRFKFKTVFTYKIDWTGPGDEGPEESITFVYGTLGVQYIEQLKTGAVGKNPMAGWNQIENKDAQDVMA